MSLLRRARLVAAAAGALLVARAAYAAGPLRTWGGELTPPEGTPPAPTQTAPPPPPPPVDAGGGQGTATPAEVAPAPIAPARVGVRYVLEGVEVRGNTRTLTPVVLRYVHFKAGDTLDVDDKEIDLTRFRLLGTGFFKDVQLSLRRGSKRGTAVLVVTVTERNTILVNDIWLGLASDAEPSGAARPLTAYGGLDVSETNLAGTGLTLGGGLAVAEDQLALRARFAAPQLLGSRWSVSAQLLFNHARDFFGNRDVLVDDPTQSGATDFALVSYERFGGQVGVARELGPGTHLLADYRLEKVDATVPLAASHVRGQDVEPIDFFIVPGGSVLSTLRGTLVHDTRDEPVLTGRGTYVSLLGELSLVPFGSSYPYGKIEARLAHWITLPWHHTLRLEARGGAIVGDAPLFERYYVGDFTDLLPDRVLNLAFDRRAAPSFFGTDVSEMRYGTYVAKLFAEYRLPLYRGTKSVYGVDAFASAGFYALADDHLLQQPPSGYDGAARFPVDFTFNLGLRVDTSAGALTLGLSTLLGFIPVRAEAAP